LPFSHDPRGCRSPAHHKPCSENTITALDLPAQAHTSGVVVVTNGPQIDPGDRSGSWSAQQNVRDSERYEAVVHANGSFRANRIRKECGPINDPQLHANCVASFGK
jgi:hypothetical protein